MKQGQVNKHKNCGRNKEEEHCKNLAWAAGARWQGLLVPGAIGYPCQVAQRCQI